MRRMLLTLRQKQKIITLKTLTKMKPEETIYNSNYGTRPVYPTDNFGATEGEGVEPKTGTPKLVKIGAAGVAGLAIGAVGFMTTSAALSADESIDAIVVDDEDEELGEVEEGGEVVAEVNVDELADGVIDFAASVNDDMSFSEAFSAARAEVGAGGAFVWHGNVYGTYTAQEWNSMSAADQQAFGSHFNWNQIDGEHQQQGSEVVAPADDNVAVDNQDEAVVEAADETNDEIPVDPVEPEVEIVGIVQDNTMGIGYVEMRVDGHETYFIDQDGDGTIDVIVSDVNDNGELDPGETQDISAEGLTIQDVADNTGLDINVIEYDTHDVPVDNPDEVADELTDDAELELTDDQALDI